ncbi:hypothetical protein G9A89_022664 [Geosiphon pyriformis]|nr:hypothetical protein G9A89_022664 [Geosiphon pyriformis]
MDQLSCQIDHAVSTCIITADKATKTPIGEIDDLPIEINGIIMSIKVLVMEATQYQALLQISQNGQYTQTPAMCSYFKTTNPPALLIKLEKEVSKPFWKAYQVSWADENHNELLPILSWDDQKKKKVHRKTYLKDLQQPKQTVKHLDEYPYDDNKIWQIAFAKIKRALPEEIRTIKNNPPKSIELDWDPEPVINLLDPEQFHKHYQKLAPIREEQEQWLKEINTRLCDHCLIPCDFQYCNKCDLIYNSPRDFQYCNKCDLIYNSPPHMMYTIAKEDKPISSCASELESIFNPNSNSNNNDNKNNDLIKEQELKWFSNNSEGIMPELVYNTNVGFDLRYPRKDAIKLEPHSHTCIDLKIALEIPTTTMVQLVSKIYTIEPNKKIAQTIFLPLVKIAQLVLVKNREKLGITAIGIQGFGLMSKVDIPVNMTEKEIINKEEIISTSKTTLCELRKIELVNLYIPAKNYSHIKISIYNNTEDIIKIPEGTTIGYLTTEIKDQLPNTIPDFP